MTVVTNGTGRRERNKTACRARIIAAGIRLFGERGIDAVTVDEIAAAADVGKGTIYNYFRAKEDIVVAHMADFERKVHARLTELDIIHRPLAESLTEYIRLQFRLKEQHHQFARVFFAQMFQHTAEFLPQMAEIHSLMRATTETLFRELRKNGRLRDVSIDDVTDVFSNMHLGLSALWAIEGPPFAMTYRVLEREVALLCEGLEVTPA